MSFWNGTFAKHRDYQHGSYFEHIMDHSASYGVGPMVMAELDPATLEPLYTDRSAVVVRIRMQDNSTYDYVVPSDSIPDRETIKAEIDRQRSTPLDGEKREVADILSFDSLNIYSGLTDDAFEWHRQ